MGALRERPAQSAISGRRGGTGGGLWEADEPTGLSRRANSHQPAPVAGYSSRSSVRGRNHDAREDVTPRVPVSRSPALEK